MSRLIAVHSYRGDTGKSTIAANLAAQLASAGRRVAVAETNFASPGLAYQFGWAPPPTGPMLADFLRGGCAIEDAVYPVGGPADGLPLWFVPAISEFSHLNRALRDGYDVVQLNRGLKALVRSLALDYLIVDTRPGFDEQTLILLAAADQVLACLRPRREDYQGTAVLIELARSLDMPMLGLLVNQALSRYDPAQIRSEVETAYGVPVPAVLPFTEALMDFAYVHGLFSLERPWAPWSQGIAAAAAGLAV